MFRYPQQWWATPTLEFRDNCGGLLLLPSGLVHLGLARGFPLLETPAPWWTSKQLPVAKGTHSAVGQQVVSHGQRCPLHGRLGSVFWLCEDCAGDALLSASQQACEQAHVQGISSGGPPLLLWSSPTVVPCLSRRSGPSPGFPLPWLSTPQPLVYYSPTCGALLLGPLSCLHTTSPSPLTGTDLWSLSLSAQPTPKHLGLRCLCWWFR